MQLAALMTAVLLASALRVLHARRQMRLIALPARR